MNYKIRVNPEQSRKVQEVCFAMGIFWKLGAVGKIERLSAPQLYIGESIAWDSGEISYKQSGREEISAEDFIKKYGKENLGKSLRDDYPDSLGFISRTYGVDALPVLAGERKVSEEKPKTTILRKYKYKKIDQNN